MSTEPSPSRGGQCVELWSRVPLVTRVMLLANLSVYILTLVKRTTPFLYPWMLCPRLVYERHEFSRLISSAFVHAGFLHIAMNMVAYVTLGTQVERALGSGPMLGVLCFLIGFGNLLYLFTGWLCDYFEIYVMPCAVGFSGVIFGVLMIETQLVAGMRRILCINLPGWMYPWCLLVGISLLMPNVSFFGHFFGIIGGWVYSKGLFCCTPPRSYIISFENRNEDALLANLSRYVGPFIKCPEQSPLSGSVLNLSLPCPNYSFHPTICCDGWLTSFQAYVRSVWRRARAPGPLFSQNRYERLEMTEQERPHLAAQNEQHIAVDMADVKSPVPETQGALSQSFGEAGSSSGVAPAAAQQSRLLAPGALARGKEGLLHEQQRKERARQMSKAINQRLLGDNNSGGRASTATAAPSAPENQISESP
eukprot:gb/GEZN01005857.1/.p1 GENE.gb/GEZN01005857.1/~~gb/GEZN01005857.1/.p1  ORF type:complete len:421 (+),score=29.57 gb/GEZN01005857.1/:26-1288(+)